jgi:hypothetical protein
VAASRPAVCVFAGAGAASPRGKDDTIASSLLSRRRFITGAAAGAAAFTASRFLTSTAEASPPQQVPAGARNAVWVWAFSEDGKDPVAVRDALAFHGMDVIFKTHDGTEWTTRSNGLGVAGPEDVRKWADFFESAGVGFHAWCDTRGNDPITEARMCSDALNSGARSMYFDLETPEGRFYWHGSNADAVTFGAELRRLQPAARLVVAPDARPWKVKEVPLAEFAAFSDAIAPQLYWEIFNSPSNYKLLADYGYFAGPEGMTPELVLDAANGALAKFGRPVHPIGGGAAKVDEWQRFVGHAYSLGMPSVSVWRYGTATPALLPTLQGMPAPQPVAQPAVEVAAPPATPTPAPPAAATPVASPAPPASPAIASGPEQKVGEKEQETVELLKADSNPRRSDRLADVWRDLGGLSRR